MSKFPVLDLWVKDWIHDTKHLRPLERGIYMDMLLLAWITPFCRVPNDIKKLVELLNYKSNEASVLQKVIEQFWSIDYTKKWLFQKRLRKEFKAAQKRRNLSEALANSRWEGKNVKKVHPTAQTRRNPLPGNNKNALRNAITATVSKNPPLPPFNATDGSARKPKRADRPTSKPKEAKPPKPVSLPSMGRTAALPKPIVAGELSAAELAAREREAIEFIHSMHKDHE